MKLQGEEAQIKHVDEEGSHGVYHLLRILKVILEGHPSSMLPYPRLSPLIVRLILKSWSRGDRRMFIWVIPYASHPGGHN